MGAADYNFNIYNSLILAGIVQGLFFGVVCLSSRKYRSAATLFLLALIVVFTFNNLQYYLQDSGIISSRKLFTIVFVPYQLIAGPLLFFYGLCLMHPKDKIPKKTLWLLLPFAIGLLYTTSYKILYAAGIIDYDLFGYFDIIFTFLEFFAIFLNMVLVVSLLLRLRRIENTSEAYSPESVSPQLSWFKIILWVFFLLCFLWIYNAILSFLYEVETAYYSLWIAMSAMIYWLGHVGVYKYGIEEERKSIRHYSIENRVYYAPIKQKNEHIMAMEKLLVGERHFLDPTLTLDKLAEQLSLSKSHLSRVINTELGMGFPDYLNALRVEEAKSYLANPEFANYTLVAIGLEAGFNSKTTFNTVFKKVTTLTPSEYRNEHLQPHTFQNPIA